MNASILYTTLQFNPDLLLTSLGDSRAVEKEVLALEEVEGRLV
jgi:hypothetical protein